MAFIVKVLGTGIVTTSTTVDGYVVPPNRSALVTSVRLINGTAAAPIPTGNIQVKPSGAASTPRSLTKKAPITSAAMQSLEDSIALGQGDSIQIAIGPPGSYTVEYSIFGVERD
jgi:hypothetical protein